jgi:hypothetical protein
MLKKVLVGCLVSLSLLTNVHSSDKNPRIETPKVGIVRSNDTQGQLCERMTFTNSYHVTAIAVPKYDITVKEQAASNVGDGIKVALKPFRDKGLFDNFHITYDWVDIGGVHALAYSLYDPKDRTVKYGTFYIMFNMKCELGQPAIVRGVTKK